MNRIVFILFLATICCVSFAQKVKFDGIVYKIDKTKEDAIVIGKAKRLEEVNILGSVTYKGIIYPVTAIKDGAFLKLFASTRMKKVSIPNSIKKIGSAAFLGCYDLEEIILPDNRISIERDAFKDCKNISIVRCQNGEFPSYAIGHLPKECPFMVSLKYLRTTN